MINIDGQNGGGQLLRSALSLSLVTGQAFRMTGIRGLRKKPGLMRQHLTGVNASVEISGGSADGAELGSTELVFNPGAVLGGDYRYAIGTAGSACLLFQTLLPALMLAKDASTLRLEGGTHNPMAPTFDFLDECFLPQVRKMGAGVEIDLERHGFYPAGGGVIHSRIAPCAELHPLKLNARGDVVSKSVRVLVAHVPEDVGRREGEAAVRFLSELGWSNDGILVETVESSGPGNVVSIGCGFENVSEMTIAFGERGKSGKVVAKEAAKAMRDYLGTKAVVGRRLADQLLLPIALAGKGEFLTMAPSNHTRTNAELIAKFLDVEFAMEEVESGQWRVGLG